MTLDRPRLGYSGAPTGPAADEAGAALLRELLPQALATPQDGDLEVLSPIAAAQPAISPHPAATGGGAIRS